MHITLPSRSTAAHPSVSVPAQSNKFGVVRLALALLVIVSHSAELVDGNRSREPLTWVFGTLSLGELAVDGFFLISGYLIARSVMQSATWQSFLANRFLRIVPAFVVAYLLTLLVAGPMVGGSVSELHGSVGATAMLRMVLLLDPRLPGAFSSLPYPVLNGSMWTIAYEARCYLLILALGLCGVLNKPRIYAVVLGMALICLVRRPYLASLLPLSPVLGTAYDGTRFYPTFLIGGGFWVLRDWVPAYTRERAMIAAGLAVACLASARLADAGVAVFGGYALFWFVLASRETALNRIGRKVDISYGLYLYAWPIQNALISAIPGISPMTVLCLSTLMASGMGWLSWMVIEKPALGLKGLLTGAEARAAPLHRPPTPYGSNVL